MEEPKIEIFFYNKMDVPPHTLAFESTCKGEVVDGVFYPCFWGEYLKGSSVTMEASDARDLMVRYRGTGYILHYIKYVDRDILRAVLTKKRKKISQ